MLDSHVRANGYLTKMFRPGELEEYTEEELRRGTKNC